jgi:branched-chain amino acid transport system substrate-binding protein
MTDVPRPRAGRRPAAERRPDPQRRRIVQAGAVVGTLGFPAIVRAQASAPLKVGVILPLTGVLGQPGLGCKRGMDLAAKMYKEQGVNLELAYVDGESKAENGRIAAERLIRDGCTVLTGCFDSGMTISAAQAAEAAKVPLVVNIAAAPQITEQGFTQVVRNFPTAPQLVSNAIRRIIELGQITGSKPQTAVLLHANDTFGQAMLGGVRALWDRLGSPVKIVETIAFAPTARDLSVEVAKAKAAKPDLLLPITRGNDAVLIVREMVKQEFVPQGIVSPGSPGPYEKPFSDALGKYADDYISCLMWHDPSQPITKRVLDRWKREYPNERFELNAGFSYEAIMIIVDALQRAKSTKSADLAAALKTTNLENHIMFGGPIRFDEKGQNNGIGSLILQNQNGGEPTVVWPQEAQQARIRWPLRAWKSR